MFQRVFWLLAIGVFCARLSGQTSRELDLVAEELEPFSSTNHTFFHMTLRSNTMYAAGIRNSKGYLAIIDVSDPLRPRLIGECEVPMATHVSVTGDHAFVTGQSAGVHVVDVSDPTKPARVGLFNTAGSALRTLVGTGDLLYVADNNQLQTLDISNPATPLSLSRLPLNGACDVAIEGRYGYVASFAGRIHVVDFQDPEAPVFVKSVEHEGNSDDVEIGNGFAYVTANGGGLIAFDLADPADPVRVGPQSQNMQEYVSVLLRDDFAYVSVRSGGIKVIDVSDPTNLQVAGQLLTSTSQPGTGGRTEGLVLTETHVVYMPKQQTATLKAVRADTAAFTRLARVDDNRVNQKLEFGQTDLLFGAFNLQTVEISDPLAPMVLSTNSEVSGVRGIAASGNVAVVAGISTLQVLGLGENDESSVLGTATIPSDFAQPRAVEVTGEIALVGGTAVQVVDISEPANPQVITNFTTWGTVHGLAANGSVMALLGGRRPFLVDFANPEEPVTLAEISPVNDANCLTIEGDLLLIGTEKELLVVDIRYPAEPELRWRARLRSRAQSLAAAGSRVYVGETFNGLEVFDVENSANPIRLGGNSAFTVNDVEARGDYAFTVTDGVGIATVGWAESIVRPTIQVSREVNTIHLRVTAETGKLVMVEQSADLENWNEWDVFLMEEAEVNLSEEVGAGPEFFRVWSTTTTDQ